MKNKSNRVIIACSVFKYELDFLLESKLIAEQVIYLDSMLHMHPERLKSKLDSVIKENKTKQIILLFGDCHAKMINYDENKNIKRTSGINCCEILLGTPEYKKIRKEKAFILLPEWAIRWREVFDDYMGFKNKESATMFMQDMHEKLVYLDSNLHEIDHSLLNEISEYTGLPVEITSCKLNNLLMSLKSSITEFEEDYGE